MGTKYRISLLAADKEVIESIVASRRNSLPEPGDDLPVDLLPVLTPGLTLAAVQDLLYRVGQIKSHT